VLLDFGYHVVRVGSGGGEIAAVNEHQAAVAERDRPPARRIDDVVLTDVHALASAVAEILHDDSEAFTVGARIHAHRHSDGDPVICGAVVRWTPVGVSHCCEPSPRRSVKHVADRLMC
jgi:hypothetical protein